MKKKINKILQYAILMIFILLLSLVSFVVFSPKNIMAANTTPLKSNAKGTGASPATDAKSPVNEKEINRLNYPSIFDLLSDQVDGDEVYIRHEDLLSYPSIFCSAKGTALPGYASTVVTSGGRSTDTTDQGQSTGTLTMRNQGSATVFKTGSSYTTSTSNPYSTTTSKTYGRFKLVETRNATPAEAWVLNEMNLNDPNINSISFEITNQEYRGEVNDGNKIVTSRNEELWSVEWDSSSLEPTKYVTKKDGKYYYVTTDAYAPYTYVQHAWWKVKTVGTSNKSGVKDTDLAYEAEAFEDYIERISTNGSNWQYNEDGTIKVDYTKYVADDGNKKEIGYDSSKVDVRFNSEANKYVVGPFTINYLRAGIKQGSREKVSFSGISKSTLIGTDANGNKLLDSNGDSVLKLGKNYKFVYDHNHEDYIPEVTVYNNGKAEKVKLDTEVDYPYPYDGEEFYIEVDYLDDLSNLESLDFDFQYMNAGASYEYLKGTYLIITWSPWYNSRLASTGGRSSVGGVINNSTKLALGISSRRNTDSGGDSSGGSKITTEEIINLETNNFEEEKTDDEFTFDKTEEFITVEVDVPEYRESEFDVDLSSTTTQTTGYYRRPSKAKLYVDSINGEKKEYDVEITNGKVSKDDIPREWKAPVKELKFELKVTYKAYRKIYSLDENMERAEVLADERQSSADHEETYKGTYYYENDIVEELQLNKSDYTYLDGDTIYLRKLGIVSSLETSLTAKLKEDEIEDGDIQWTVRDCFSASEGKDVTLYYDMPRDSEYIVEVSVYSDHYYGGPIQQFTFKVMFEKMYLKNTTGIISGGTDTKELTISNDSSAKTYYIFNAYLEIYTDSTPSGVPDNQNPIVIETNESDLNGGIVQFAAAPDNVELIEHTGILWWSKENVTPQEYLEQSMVYSYSDDTGKEVTISIEATVYSTNAYKDKIEDYIAEYLNNPNLYTLKELKNLLKRAKDYGVDQSKISQLEEAIKQKEEQKQSEEEEKKAADEAKKKAAEEAEKERQKAEEESKKIEKERQKAEEELQEAEEERQKAEEESKKIEKERQEEEARQRAEERRQKAEEAAKEAAKAAEEAAKAAEEAAKAAEVAAQVAEEARKRAEGNNTDDRRQDGEQGTLTGGEEGIWSEGDEIAVARGLQSNGARQYQYYLRFTNASEQVGQDQINGRESVKKNVDAQNGRGEDVAGSGIHLEIIPEPINLRTALSGMVWIDNDEQKDSSYGKLGIYDGKDKPAATNSVEITVWKVKYEVSSGKELERELATAWDKEGNVIDFVDNRIFVDENGRYEIPEIQVPAEEGLDGSKYVISYDVEFIYDGQTYEATEYLVPSSGENKTSVSDKLASFKKTADQTKGEAKDYTEYVKSSYIVENADERKDFDSYFTEVYGGGDATTHTKAISEDGKTDGKATGGAGGSQYNNVVTGDLTEKEATLNYDSTVVTGDSGAEKTKSKLITNDNEGYVLPQYRFAARTSEGGLLLPYERLYHVEEKYYDNLTFQKNQYKPVDEYFNQINLGLLERYHSDLGVKKDLYMANVVVNGHSNVTTYNNLAALTDEALALQVGGKYREQKYNIDLYNSDFMYRSSAYSSITDEITKKVVEAIKEDTELRLFVTYKMEFINESVYTDVSVNEFKDYYDKTFTRVDKDVTAVIEDQTSDDGEPARKEKIVAYAPYYRKLKTVATPTAYKYNKIEDLNQAVGEDGNVKNTVVNGNGELILDTKKDQSFVTGDVVFNEYNNYAEPNADYKTSYSTSLNAYKEDGSVDTDLTLEPGEVMEVFVTYEVDKEGFEKAKEETQPASDSRKDSLLGNKNNIVEISRYTTQYTTEGLQRHNTLSYKAEQISGRIEQDSAPDNINMAKLDSTKLMEDDTEFAPCVTVQVRQTDPRTLNGIVWEDSRTDGAEGDGIYNPDTEKGIGDIDVTLVEKIRVTKEDLDRINAKGSDSAKANISDLSIVDHEFEYIWPSNTFDEFTNGIKSSADEGSLGQYQFKNFVTGTYVVRFEYGNDANSETDMKYNGQDYKNTAYQALADGSIRTNPDPATASEDEKTKIPTDTSDIKHLAGKSTLNNEWHDLSENTKAKQLESDRVSDARDYEPQRIRVNAYSRTITNKNAEVLAAGIANNKDVTGEEAKVHVTGEYQKLLEENKEEFTQNTRMVANSAKLFVDVEKQDTISYKTVEASGEKDVVKTTEGSGHKYEISNIDFGLVERPETRINVQKEISKIQLTKNDGRDVILSVECDEAGNIIKSGGSAENTIRVEKVVEIHKDTLGSGQGFKYIAMESSFLKGLQVKLTYNISIYNNSEKDYVSADLANKKNIGAVYELANSLEGTDTEKLYSDEGISNTVPYNCGKGIIYGRYLGLHYYTNKHYESEDDQKNYESNGFDRYGQEVEVTTTVDQLADYIDNDLNISMDDTENYENQVWVNSSDIDRKEKLSEIAYEKDQDGKYTKDDKMLQDDKERAYVGNTNNNISVSVNSTMTEKPVEVTYTKTMINENKQPVMKKNDQGVIVPEVEDKKLDVYTTIEGGNANATDTYNPRLTTELKPGENSSIKIVTIAQANEEAINNMNYDNLVEIVMYSNTVGRRDMQAIPGNANMIAKDEKAYMAGYNRIVKTENNEVVKDADGNTVYEWVHKEAKIKDDVAEGKMSIVHTERDTYAARDTVTFSEPTGLSLERQKINTIIRIILIGLIIAAITTITITVTIVIRKTKYDDKDIMNPENKN